MQKRILAGVTVLAFSAGVMSSAMALDQKAGRGGHHIKGFRAGGMHSSEARRNTRFSGVRGFESWRQNDRGHGGYHGGFIDLGPLGITAACGSYRYKNGGCGPGYSVSAWSY
jgi:hypothetical protein